MSGTKKKKILIEIFMVVGVAVVIFAAIIASVMKSSFESLEHYEDTNGESKELCHITDQEIAEMDQRYRLTNSQTVNKGIKASGVKGDAADRDNEYTKLTAEKLSGIYIANAYLGNGSMVTYKIVSAATAGNLRIVITDENNAILHDVPIDQEYQISFVAEAEKFYYVKFIGESAEIEVELWRIEQ